MSPGRRNLSKIQLPDEPTTQDIADAAVIWRGPAGFFEDNSELVERAKKDPPDSTD